MRVASIVYQLVVGMSLLTLPWSRFWQENWFIWHTTGSIRFFLLSGAARGAVSGLGAGILFQALGWSFADGLPGAAPVRMEAGRETGVRGGTSIATERDGPRAPDDAHAARSPDTVDPPDTIGSPAGACEPGSPAAPGRAPTV